MNGSVRLITSLIAGLGLSCQLVLIFVRVTDRWLMERFLVRRGSETESGRIPVDTAVSNRTRGAGVPGSGWLAGSPFPL